MLKSVDAFSLSHVVPAGSPLLNHPTPLGGACSLLSLLAFFTLAIVLILQYAYGNVSVQTSLGTLVSTNPFLAPSIQWAAPAAASPLAPTLRSGVQVRIFSQEGLGCTSLAEGSSIISTPPSAWELAPPSDCGDGRTLIVLSCPACSLTATSTLAFHLPYTCQAFAMEAIAVDSLGVVNSVAFPHASSAATRTALVTAVAWTVEVLGTLLQDTIKGESKQGYQLSVAAAAASSAPVGPTIIPAMSTVAVTVSLPLQTFYSLTLLQPRQSLVELLSSIVGLLGIIGLFRVLFLTLEVTLKQAAFISLAVSKRRLSAAPPSSAAQQPAGDGREACTGHTNPLRRGGAPHAADAEEATPGGTIGLPPAPHCHSSSKWERYEDEK